MERVRIKGTGELFPRFIPYIVAVLVVLVAEFLYFGTDLPVSFLAFVVVGALALVLFALNPYWAILGLFLIKPILDTMWGTYSSGGIKGTWLMGVIGPLVWLFGMLYYRISPLDYKLGRTMIFWGACCLLPMILIPFSTPGVAPLLGPLISLKLLNGWGFYFLIPFLIKSREDFNLFIYAWLASTVVPAILGLYYLITGNPWGFQITAGWWRLSGPYHDAAAFMTEIAPGLPIMLYLASGAKIWWKRVLWLIPIGIWLILAFNSYTRSFWISASLTMLIWALVGIWQPLALAALGTIYKWGIIWKRFTVAGIEDIDNPYALGGRMGLWETFWTVFKKVPWPEKLIGYWAFSEHRSWRLPDLHIQYTQMIFHLGIFGFISFMSILFGFFYYIFRIVFTKPNCRREGLLGLSLLIFAAVLSGTGGYFFVPNNQWLLFGSMGILINSDVWCNDRQE